MNPWLSYNKSVFKEASYAQYFTIGLRRTERNATSPTKIQAIYRSGSGLLNGTRKHRWFL